MKKTAAALAALTAAGFTGLSMAPASAAPYFANCGEAEAAGVYNIHYTDYRYDRSLDADGDGYGCDNSAYPLAPVLTSPANVPADPTSNGFPNCSVAEAYGAVNIPVGDPRYAPHLDSDSDGIACEQGGEDDVVVDPLSDAEHLGGNGYDQVSQVPVGGADTGAEGESAVPGLALAGGLTLAAAAGATVAVRRRATRA